MLLCDCKRAALAIADGLSNPGTPPYTQDADAIRKLPIFINQGLMILAQRKKRIKKAEFSNQTGQPTVFSLPTDFYQLKTVEGEGARLTPDRKLETAGDGNWTVWYFAYPQAVTAASAENTLLDADEDTAAALPFYAAAMLLLSVGDPGWVNCQARFDSMMVGIEPDDRMPGARLVV